MTNESFYSVCTIVPLALSTTLIAGSDYDEKRKRVLFVLGTLIVILSAALTSPWFRSCTSCIK